MSNDAAYFAVRAQQEREAALHAAHPNARQCHTEMADAYEHRVRLLLAAEARAEIHLVSAA
jgi:hypothetical protein